MQQTQTQQIMQQAIADGKVGLPFLQLGAKVEGGGVNSTGEHTLKFISDQKVMGVDFMTKQPREEMEYIFEENGMKKRYNVPLLNKEGKIHYFLVRMNDCQYGETIILEMKKDGPKNYIDFKRTIEPLPTVQEEDIPVIEEDSQKVVSQKQLDGTYKDVPYDENTGRGAEVPTEAYTGEVEGA